jgi:hypothetical protein
MHPPSSDPSAPSRPEPFPSGPYSPYKPNPHSFPLYSTKLTFHLPLANVNTRLFFHAYGEDAVGSVAFLDSQTNVRQNKAAFEGGTQTIAGESVKETGMKVMDSSRGDVEVTIQIVFASKAKMQERVRIYKEVDSSTGKVGVYIMVRFSQTLLLLIHPLASFELTRSFAPDSYPAKTRIRRSNRLHQLPLLHSASLRILLFLLFPRKWTASHSRIRWLRDYHVSLSSSSFRYIVPLRPVQMDKLQLSHLAHS